MKLSRSKDMSAHVAPSALALGRRAGWRALARLWIILFAVEWTGADLINTASIRYQTPSGTVQTTLSNTVTVRIENPPIDLLETPDLSGIDGKILTNRDTLTVRYRGIATGFNWQLSALSTAASARFGSLSQATSAIAPVSTASPSLSLAPLSLSPGRYEVRAQAIEGSRLSAWAVASMTIVDADASTVRVRPNPWRSSRGDSNILFDTPIGSTVKLFTVSGRWVATLDASSGQASWDLKNSSGDSVASGIYLYVVTHGDSNPLRGKVTIIR